MRPLKPKKDHLEPAPPERPDDVEAGDDAAIGGADVDSDEEPELDFDTEN